MPTATAKTRTRTPKTASQQRAEQGVIDVRIVGYELPQAKPTDGNGSDAGGRLGPPSPPASRRTGGGRRPLPPWARFVLWAGIFLLAFLTGALIGRAGVALERSLERASPGDPRP